MSIKHKEKERQVSENDQTHRGFNDSFDKEGRVGKRKVISQEIVKNELDTVILLLIKGTVKEGQGETES